MPFANAHHGGDREPLHLTARIDAELRARIEDAVDYACLDAMVKAREPRGAPPPVADDPADREEYTRRVHEFLERMGAALLSDLTPEQRRRLGEAAAPRPGGIGAALALQVALAKELPDYWQRFEAVREAALPGQSGGDQRRSLLRRLLGR